MFTLHTHTKLKALKYHGINKQNEYILCYISFCFSLYIDIKTNAKYTFEIKKRITFLQKIEKSHQEFLECVC